MTIDELSRLLPIPRDVDDDLVVAWRSAKNDAALAYDRWCDAARNRKPETYWVYLAAADREGAAAEALRRHVRAAA
jgi:hypothetical protein